MDNLPTPHKKGIGALGWIGIGCGSIVGLCIVGALIFTFLYGGKIKEFAEEAQKNPAKATATAMVSASFGQFELVAQDDVLKRYTVREKQSGNLTTIYWDAKKNAPEQVAGDFSAIPADATEPTAPVPVPDAN